MIFSEIWESWNPLDVKVLLLYRYVDGVKWGPLLPIVRIKDVLDDGTVVEKILGLTGNETYRFRKIEGPPSETMRRFLDKYL